MTDFVPSHTNEDRPDSRGPFPITDGLDNSVCAFESVEHYPEENEYRAIFDSETVAPSIAIIGAVSALSEQHVMDIDPLYSVIDPDGLDFLMNGRKAAQGDIRVSLELAGYEVTVSSYGGIVVSSLPSDDDVPGGDDGQ